MSKFLSLLTVYVRMFLLFLMKILSHLFYRTRQKWLSKDKNWDDVNLVVFLNHTSLFEFVYTGIVPFSYLRKMAHKLTFPVADITYKRKIFGRFLKILGVSVKSLSRKKDQSWFNFLGQLKGDSILIFLPEGRMKRRGGLDKMGKKMTVRGGIVDVLHLFKGKKMLFAYSGGLHHVLAPGDPFPRLLQDIDISLETMNVNDYLKPFLLEDGSLDRLGIFKDLGKEEGSVFS